MAEAPSVRCALGVSADPQPPLRLRSRRAWAASKLALYCRSRPASSCRRPKASVPQPVRRRLPERGRHGEALGPPSRRGCPVRSGAWERRGEDPQRAFPIRRAATAHRSDICFVPGPASKDQVRSPRVRRRSASANRSPGQERGRHRPMRAKALQASDAVSENRRALAQVDGVARLSPVVREPDRQTAERQRSGSRSA